MAEIYSTLLASSQGILIAPDRIFCQLVIPGDPQSKSRPRFAGHVYTSKKTRRAQEVFAWEIRAAYPALVPNRSHDLGVSLAFFRKTRQRIDIDNLLKLALDACTGLLWGDDVQVIEITSRLIRGDEDPRTELCVYTIGDSYQTTCQICDTLLPSRARDIYRAGATRFCSKTCYDVAQRKGQYVFCHTCKARLYRQNDKLQQKRWFCSAACRTRASQAEKLCRFCQKPFMLSHHLMRHRSFCSLACRTSWHDAQRAPSQQPAQCPTCHAPSAVRRGAPLRCFSCYLKSKGSTPLTPTQMAHIISLRQQGASKRTIAQLLNISRYRIDDVIAYSFTEAAQMPLLPLEDI